ncbi:hypothetical protein BJ165DRAFT_1407160 [Panaeolus papilionaceus]|nr:hypothetical protein BJ165DRAFT_1407160 [Panaeolus papilionaceus]
MSSSCLQGHFAPESSDSPALPSLNAIPTGFIQSKAMDIEQFPCYQATSKEKELLENAHQLAVEEVKLTWQGNHTIVYPHPENSLTFIKKLDFNSHTNRALLAELHGLQRTQQLIKCLYFPGDNGGNVLDHSLSWAMNLAVFTSITKPNTNVYNLIRDKISNQALRYARISCTGHRSTPENLEVDLVDWCNWDNTPTKMDIEVYRKGYMESAITMLLTTLEYIDRSSDSKSSSKSTK